MGMVILIGFCLGGGAAAAAIWLPYDRVVVFDQPPSKVVRVSSVRMRKAGFIVVFLKEPQGWTVVGSSNYMRSGYYRNFVIPIDVSPPLYDLNNPFLIRIYKDNGDLSFDELTDMPVKDLFGKVYSKRFWAIPHAQPVRQGINKFLDDPLQFFGQILFP